MAVSSSERSSNLSFIRWPRQRTMNESLRIAKGFMVSEISALFILVKSKIPSISPQNAMFQGFSSGLLLRATESRNSLKLLNSCLPELSCTFARSSSVMPLRSTLQRLPPKLEDTKSAMESQFLPLSGSSTPSSPLSGMLNFSWVLPNAVIIFMQSSSLKAPPS